MFLYDETLKEHTAGSSVAPNLSERMMERCCIGSASTTILKNAKQAEFYLAEGQRLTHTGCWAFNAAGFEYWSPELFRIHGLEPGGKAPSIPEYTALVYLEHRESVAQEIQQARWPDRRGFDFTKRIVRPDRVIRHVRCVGVPATNVGIFQRFVGTGDLRHRPGATSEGTAQERRGADRAGAQRLEAMGTLAGCVAQPILQYPRRDPGLRRDGDARREGRQRPCAATWTPSWPRASAARALVDRILAFSRSGVGERVAVHVEEVVHEGCTRSPQSCPRT